MHSRKVTTSLFAVASFGRQRASDVCSLITGGSNLEQDHAALWSLRSESIAPLARGRGGAGRERGRGCGRQREQGEQGMEERRVWAVLWNHKKLDVAGV